MLRLCYLTLGLSLGRAVAVPAPVAQTASSIATAQAPQPTVAPDLNLAARDIFDDAETYIKGLASDVGSRLSSFVNSGILDYPSGFPTGDKVKKSLGIDDDDLKAQPTQVLNLPAYGNWTKDGWNVRVHGNVYKLPNISQDKVDDLANVFLIDTDVDKLSDSEAAQARNVTRSIFVVQQNDESVTMDFVNNVDDETNARGGSQKIKLPYNTTLEGDFDAWVTLKNTSGSNNGYLIPGNQTSKLQTLNMYAEGKNNSGNATTYLVPPRGITVISDIDDILRITKIYQPKEGLLNTFARKFTPWMNMPDIYANWSAKETDWHFHYLTTTPEQVTRNYMDFIYNTYPLGSFDTRPLNFSDVSATLSIRRFLLDKIFRTFPDRKFILVGDTTNSDVMKAYPALYKDYPGQVQCILLRNTTATDSKDKFPYNTKGFEKIPDDHYMFFLVPDDLTNLDLANGKCRNSSIPQNVTFSYQGLPFGIGDDDSMAMVVTPPQKLATIVAGLVMAVVFTFA